MEGALLVSEKTVKKARGRKKQQQQTEAALMPDTPSASEGAKGKGKRGKAAPVLPAVQSEPALEVQPMTEGMQTRSPDTRSQANLPNIYRVLSCFLSLMLPIARSVLCGSHADCLPHMQE